MDFQSMTSIDVINPVRGGDPEKAIKAISAIAAACVGGLALLGITGACTTPKSIPPILCKVLEPIEYSINDTEKTKEQVYVYNSVWNENCR